MFWKKNKTVEMLVMSLSPNKFVYKVEKQLQNIHWRYFIYFTYNIWLLKMKNNILWLCLGNSKHLG